MKLIYNIGVRILYQLMYLASFFNSKASAWIDGQKQEIKSRTKSCIWIHCASLGEYKQAQPLASLLTESGYDLVFTFYSPSGFIYAKSKYPVYYLPLDTASNAKTFIRKTKPTLAIFVRSEYWYNYISELKNQGIPLVIINSYFQKDQYFFKWYGKWFYNQLNSIRFFYPINKEISQLLTDKELTNHLNVGDTKVDQVMQAQAASTPINLIIGEKKVILCASVEKGDQAVVKNIIEKCADEYVIVIVPHEHTPDTYEFYNKLLTNELTKYTNLGNEPRTLIYVDKFGVLPLLFKSAWVSYIGGGFDKGIHNILESCIEGKPMVYGPNYNKFPEAQTLINTKAALAINKPAEIIESIKHFKSKDNYDKATLACDKYITNNKGATKAIYSHLKKNGLI